MNKITNEEFVKRIANVTDTLISTEEYKGSNVKIRFKCTIHNYEWMVRPNSILNNTSHCPICSGFIRTKESFFEDFRKKENNKTIEVIGDYIGTHKPISVKCKIDGHVWTTTPHSLLQGHGCKECQRKKLADIHLLDQNVFYERAKNNKKVEIIGKYKNSKTKIKVRCKIHDYVYHAYPNSIIKNCGCIKCREDATILANKKTNKKFVSQLISKYGENVTALDTYIDDVTPIAFKHKCGCIFYNKPTNILQNLSCPECYVKSKGESFITDFLESNSINFVAQKTFDDLKGIGGRKLSYDFYLPSYNLLIEYQGEQHKRPIVFKGTTLDIANKNFNKQKEHDKRKQTYSQTNGIELLEIWYWDFDNINIILKKKLGL